MDINLALQITIVLPLAGAALVYLAGRLHARRYGDSSERNPAGWIALGVLVLTGTALALAARSGEGNTAAWQVGQIHNILDGMGLLLAVVAVGLGSVVVLFSTRYMRG